MPAIFDIILEGLLIGKLLQTFFVDWDRLGPVLVINVGLGPRVPGRDRVTFEMWILVVFKGLFIKGIYGREIFETWYKGTMMVQSGIPLEKIITHRYHYTDFQKGFDMMRSGQSGKVILNWDEPQVKSWKWVSKVRRKVWWRTWQK